MLPSTLGRVSEASNSRWKRPRADARTFVVLALLAAVPGGAHGEKKAGAPLDKPSVAGIGTPAIPDAYKMNMLVRTTLIALSQANQTGNYSVLRDLGSPEFQAMNTDANLAMNFAALRSRNLDLSPVIFFDPKLLRAPALQPNGILRLTGFLDTKPERVLFDLGFQSVEGQWRLAAIVVDIKPPTTEPAKPPTQSGNAAGPKNAPSSKAKPAKSSAPAAAN